MNKKTPNGTRCWIIRNVARLLGVVTVIGMVAGCQASSESGEPAANVVAGGGRPRAPAHGVIDQYYLSTCAVCEGMLGAKGEAAEVVHADRHLRFCTQACADRFSADPVVTLSAIDRRLIEDQRPWYPVSKSLFDGRALGEHPIEFILGNRLFRAVDERDKIAILADPIGAVRTLDRAVIEAQRPAYGMPNKCPVQGDILENESRIDIVVANRMVRVCCERCVRVVKARPYQFLSMVEYATREALTRQSGEDADGPNR